MSGLINREMGRKNIYIHEIDLKQIKVLNAPKDKFAEEILKIPYRGYEVENISDGRKIVITKPGGKSGRYGIPKKEDFLVFIYDSKKKSFWQISHKQIFEDLQNKAAINAKETIEVIESLEKVYRGEEPDDVLRKIKLNISVGEPVEVLLKVYKWIWGQEDVNYPNHKGRAMCMEGILNLKDELKKQIKMEKKVNGNQNYRNSKSQ